MSLAGSGLMAFADVCRQVSEYDICKVFWRGGVLPVHLQGVPDLDVSLVHIRDDAGW